MNNETSILKTKEEQIKAEKSYLGKDMDDLTVEELHQLNEDIFNLENAKDAIGEVHAMKFSQYWHEKNKPNPDQSVVDKLKRESLQLSLERDSLYSKTREEIKKILDHYSKIIRNNYQEE